MNKAYETYKTVTVDTASQGKLILIAYDVAIKSCKGALEAFDSYRQIEERTRHLFKAQDAITELMSALRMDVGEISRNLYRLYDYMLRRLVESNVKNDPKCVEEVLGYLETLRGAWDTAIASLKKESMPAMAAPMGERSFAISG